MKSLFTADAWAVNASGTIGQGGGGGDGDGRMTRGRNGGFAQWGEERGARQEGTGRALRCQRGPSSGRAVLVRRRPRAPGSSRGGVETPFVQTRKKWGEKKGLEGRVSPRRGGTATTTTTALHLRLCRSDERGRCRRCRSWEPGRTRDACGGGDGAGPVWGPWGLTGGSMRHRPLL